MKKVNIPPLYCIPPESLPKKAKYIEGKIYFPENKKDQEQLNNFF